MQYDENAEKYGYEGEMTPMKCDELKAEQWLDYGGEPRDCYPRVDVDEAIAELKDFAENVALERDDNQTAIDELQAENAELKAANKLLKEHIANGDVSRITWIDEVIELKQKLESVQASMYADVVDANMENRRLRRALWLARAYRAKAIYTYWHVKCIEGHLLYEHKWIVVERKCRAKAEEYK